jgi:hypothetical protein
MLKIVHNIKGDEQHIGLRVDGNFIDVAPLFLLTKVRKRVKDFMGINAIRKNYIEMVELEIKEPSIKIDGSKIYYHMLIVKALLHAIDLFDFERAIASVWKSNTLPMLSCCDFEVVTLGLSTCGKYGERKTIPVQIMRRIHDGYYNLTLMLRNIAEGSKKTPTSIVKNKTMLYKRLYATTHSSDDIKKMNSGTSTKIEKTELDANKRALISEYITINNATETWVEPNVFFSSILDCSIDAHMLMSAIMSSFIFGRKIKECERYTIPSSCISYEYINDERKEQLCEELSSQIQKTSILQSDCTRDIRKLKKIERLLMK